MYRTENYFLNTRQLMFDWWFNTDLSNPNRLVITAADSGHQKSKTQNQKSICKVKSQTQKAKVDLWTKKSP